METKKAQTTMVLMFLVLIIFGMLFLFLLSFADTFNREDYVEQYVSDLLLSLVRTDTGYSDEFCKSVGNAMASVFMHPSYFCGTENCEDIAISRVGYYLDRFDLLKQNFEYFLRVEPQTGVFRDENSIPIEFEIGDEAVVQADEKFTAKQIISQGMEIFEATLYIAYRD